MPYCTHLISDEDDCHPFEMRNTLMTKTDFEIHFLFFPAPLIHYEHTRHAANIFE